MSYSLNSLKRGIYLRGSIKVGIKGVLGVSTMAHVDVTALDLGLEP